MSTASASLRPNPGSGDAPHRAASDVADNPWGARALRFGIGARGVVFLVVAYLVARIALGALGEGGTDKSASGPGAAKAIAEQNGGHVALVVLGIGMVLFALFCVVDAIRNKGNGDSEPKRWAKRAAAVGRAIVYGGFAVYCFLTAASSTSGGSSGDSRRQQTQWSAEVLRWPAGWLWLGALGVVLFAIAAVQVSRAVRRSFLDELREWRMTRRARQLTVTLGVIGFAGRAAAYGLVGWFVVAAAAENNPDKGKGVDGAARMLASSSGGPVLLWALAIALGTFGLYLFCESHYRRL